MLFLSQTDSELAKIIKDPGFAQWLFYAYIVFVIADRVWSAIERRKVQKREITGTMETRPHQTPALKDDVDEEFDDVDKRLDGIKTFMEGKFKEVLDAGERRAASITQHINSEVSAIRANTDARVADLQNRIQQAAEKDAKHEEAITTLKSTTSSQANQISHIQQRMPRSRLP
ncbi:MAG: hypothetical protein V4662_25035 [Verrucomicrobiota bacterium]